MRTITATEARNQIFQIANAGQRVEITHPKHTMVLLPKEELEQLELKLLDYEMQRILSSGQKKYTGVEVEAMLAEVMRNA